MRIGELATRTGASARSLRYYEDRGLLRSERSAGGQRHYPQVAVERVTLIQSLLAASLSTDTILEVLPCINDEALRTPWLATRLTQELDRVEQRIADLQHARRILAELVRRYQVVDRCPAHRSAGDDLPDRPQPPTEG